MPTVAVKKQSSGNVSIVKRMKDYSKEPTFKKKAEDAIAFLKKHALPKSFKKGK